MPDGAIFEPFSFTIKNINTYLESFKQARRHQAQKSAGFDSKIKSELYNILYNMQAEYHAPYANFKIIEPAVNYIHANYDKENIRVELLASLCGISTVYLRNTFKKRFNMSPINYINDLKMTRAKELLHSQFYTVSEVCFLSGYNNESYFCREFKKHFGITPSEYMRTT
jgi:AraC-like DNA-binding protein